MGLADQLLNVERQLWKNDAVLYGRMLVDEALLVFPETGVITKEAALEAIQVENREGRRWAKVAFDEVRALQLADQAAALTYKVTARWEHESSNYTALGTSIYVQRQGGWKLALHQQTPLEGK